MKYQKHKSSFKRENRPDCPHVSAHDRILQPLQTHTHTSLICPDLIPACLTQIQTCEAASHRNNLFIWVSTKDDMLLNDLPPAATWVPCSHMVIMSRTDSGELKVNRLEDKNEMGAWWWTVLLSLIICCVAYTLHITLIYYHFRTEYITNNKVHKPILILKKTK